ncbi:MAG: hypothetical protein EBR09_13675 [Proteobacteria bacterium]|nr:hypothetical protein [Pseudomonadota bacterium]
MKPAEENIEKSDFGSHNRSGMQAGICAASEQCDICASGKGLMGFSFVKLTFRTLLLPALILSALLPDCGHAHGFNANHADIVKTFGRKYRVIIKYTHVEAGEYREAHIDFDKKEEAVKAFQDLVKGADFFLGDIKKSIHFHTPPESNSPY